MIYMYETEYDEPEPKGIAEWPKSAQDRSEEAYTWFWVFTPVVGTVVVLGLVAWL